MININKKILIGLAISCFFTVIIVSTSYFFWKKNKAEINKPKNLLAESILLAKKGQFNKSYTFLKEALEISPANKEAHWVLAQVALSLKNSELAQKHALEAWRYGKREKDVLFFIARGSGLLNLKEKINYARKMLQDIPEKSTREELRADLHIALDEGEEALTIYQQLYNAQPSPQLTSKIVLTLIKLKNDSKAYTFIKEAFREKQLDEDGYILFTSMAYLEGMPQEDLISIFSSAKEIGLYGPKLIYHHSLINVINGNLDEAKNILYTKKEEINTSDEASKSRLLLSLVSFLEGNNELLKQLNSSASGDDASLEGERLLYSALLEYNETKSAQNFRHQFDKAYRLIPENFITNLLNARLLISEGAQLKALEFYENIENPLYKSWPLIIVDHAKALIAAEQNTKALELITSFHQKRKSSTLQTALLQRDLLLELKEFKAAIKVQNYIEASYPITKDIKIKGATIALEYGDVKSAEKKLLLLDKEFPNDNQVSLLYTSILLKENRYQEMLDYLNLQKLSSQNIQLKALALSKLNKPQEVEELYQASLKETPSEEIYRSYYNFLLTNKQNAKADETLIKATKLYPKANWTVLTAARLDMQKGQFQKVLTRLESTPSIKTNSLEAQLLSAEANFKLKNFKTALSESKAILSSNNQEKAALTIKALSLFQLKQYSLALPAIKEALASTPSDTSLKISLTRCLLLLKKHQESLLHATELYNSRPHVPIIVDLYLSALLGNSMLKEAEALIEKEKANLNEEQIVSFKTSILLQRKDYQAALKLLKPQINNPKFFNIWFYIESRFGDIELAIKEGKEKGLTVEQWTILAEFAGDKKMYDDAVFCLKKALLSEGDNPVLLNNCAWYMWKAKGSVDEQALACARKASDLKPNDFDILDTYANMLIESRQYEKCINKLRAIVNSADADARLLYWQAQAYEGKGLKPQAIQYYTRALNLQLQENWLLSIKKEELIKKIEMLKKS